jgi:hypothetical protein
MSTSTEPMETLIESKMMMTKPKWRACVDCEEEITVWWEDAEGDAYCAGCFTDAGFTCDGCHNEECVQCNEDEEEEDTITEDTIIAGIVCRACSHTLPPMTVKQHLNGDFNKTCPHTA